jgi:Flp pilus assembly protein TadD
MKIFSGKSLSVLGKFIIVGGVAGGCLGLYGALAQAEDAPAAPVQLAPPSAAPTMPEPMAGMMPPHAALPPASAPTMPPSPEQMMAAPVPAPMSPPVDTAAAPQQPPKAGGPLAAPSGETGKKPSKNAKAQEGKKGQDAPVQDANIRALPEKYLVVKKEQNADAFSTRLLAARTALAQDRLGAAFELFNELYAKYPKDKSVLIGRAVAMQKLGQNAEALVAYEEALNNDPKNLEALTNMLGILNTQDRSSAIERLSQLQGVYPFNADISAQLGMVYGAAGEYEKALKYLDMADAMKPGNPDILYNRAVAYDRMGKTQQAAGLYHQIVLLSGDIPLDAGFPIEAVKKRLADIH